jgi:hypothetical protein
LVALPAVVAALVVVLVVVVFARGGDDLERQTVPGVLSMEVPSGWQLEDDEEWDKPEPLGPHALQAHPGLGLVGTFEEDDRAFVFIGIPDPSKVTSLEGLLSQQAAHWNPNNLTCEAYEPVMVNRSRDVRWRWVGCSRSDTFLQRAWRKNGIPVYALARLNDELSEATAEKMLESLEVLAPSG